MTVDEKQRKPRFNHVAMSLPATSLNSESRQAILAFYGDVFGFTEMPGMTKDGELLVLRVFSNEQFIYLLKDDNPMRCPRMDHFGLSVDSPETLHAMYERALKYQQGDPRVDLIAPDVEEHAGVVKIHNFYARLILPMMIEIQCFRWQ